MAKHIYIHRGKKTVADGAGDDIESAKRLLDQANQKLNSAFKADKTLGPAIGAILQKLVPIQSALGKL